MGPHILFVDDDPMISGIYAKKLKTFGFQVDVASDGASARRHMEQQTPAAVVLDIMLPDIGGFQVLQWLRERPATAETPVLILSNTITTAVEDDATRLGAHYLLDKAVMTPRILAEVLQQVLPFPSGAEASLPRPVEPVPEATPEHIELHAQYQKSFCHEAAQASTSLQKALDNLRNNPGDPEALARLARTLHPVSNSAAAAGFLRLSRLTGAIEALVSQIASGVVTDNISLHRTFYQATEILCEALKTPDQLHDANFHPAILAVDDDLICRKLVRITLEKMNLNPLVVADAATALELLEENSFDIVLLDVDMPDMKGDQICAHMRQLPRHKLTPVIFVTGLLDFKTSAKTLTVGGNDIIAKPFIPLELAVKVLTFVLRNQVQIIKQTSPLPPHKSAPVINLRDKSQSFDFGAL